MTRARERENRAIAGIAFNGLSAKGMSWFKILLAKQKRGSTEESIEGYEREVQECYHAGLVKIDGDVTRLSALGWRLKDKLRMKGGTLKWQGPRTGQLSRTGIRRLW